MKGILCIKITCCIFVDILTPRIFGHWELFFTRYNKTNLFKNCIDYILCFSLISYYYSFQLIQFDDPFEYNSLNDLVRAIESPDIAIIPLRRQFDPNIVDVLNKMLKKVM
jgi:hypothetical protein